MSIAQYCLSWDSHKTYVCKGFTNLQQNEEFVDMTLAADGHVVKVHKSIFALASPYIKTMLQSTNSQHPVIFLNNVSHEVLNCILTYVYTGEVSVEVDKIKSFLRVARDLRISGLVDIPAPRVNSSKNNETPNANDTTNTYKNAISHINQIEKNCTKDIMVIDSEDVGQQVLPNSEELNKVVPVQDIVITESNVSNTDLELCVSTNELHTKINPATANEYVLNEEDYSKNGYYLTTDGFQYRLEVQNQYGKPSEYAAKVIEETSHKCKDSIQVQTDNNTDTLIKTIDKDHKIDASTSIIGSTQLPSQSSDPKGFSPQYSISNRGSLQLILNRYVYYCHHKSHGGRKRRWRCIDYRKNNCRAFIDTDNEIMTIRKFVHSHSFHDEQIRKKLKRNLIFTNINAVSKRNNKNDGESE